MPVPSTTPHSTAHPLHMVTSRVTLSFTGAHQHLEPLYRETRYQGALWQIRAYLLIAAIFNVLFGFLDALLLPSVKETLWCIRFYIICPLLLVILLVSFSRHFYRVWEEAVALMCIAAGLGIIAMIVLAPPPNNYLYYAGLILVLFFSYTLTPPRFIWASFTGWLLVLFYEVAAVWLSNTPVPIIINNNFFFISTNLIGMIGTYFAELTARRNFFLMHLLERERRKVNSSNQALADNVQQLQGAMEKIKTLSGFIPICANCKKIRDDKGYWNQIESYISTHSEAEFSHGICPECVERLYPEL